MADIDYCDCDVDIYPEVYNCRVVKSSRKPHRCDECGVTIPIGSSYRYTFTKVDGYTYDVHVCELCVELETWAVISVPCFCYMVGELHDTVHAMVKDVAPKIPGLFFEYGRRMVAIRRQARMTAS